MIRNYDAKGAMGDGRGWGEEREGVRVVTQKMKRWKKENRKHLWESVLSRMNLMKIEDTTSCKYITQRTPQQIETQRSKVEARIHIFVQRFW